MPSCFECMCRLGSIKDLLNHLKRAHGIYERKDRYRCCEGQCARTFSDKYVFTNHLVTNHAASEIVTTTTSYAPSGTVDSYLSADDDEEVGLNLDTDVPQPLALKDLAHKFILKAKARMTSLDNVQYMVGACADLVEAIVSDLRASVHKCKSAPAAAELWDSLDEKLTLYSKPFDGLETEHRQREYLHSLGFYVPPEEYTLGTRQTFQVDKAAGFCKPVRVNVTEQFVSVKSTLLALSNHTDLIEIASRPAARQESVLQTFRDGKHWQNHPLRDQPTIVLRFYGDDVEPANPLGSHRTAYKIGCVYFQLEDLPMVLQSKIDNIFLALCYHSNDVKEYGWQAVLEPLLTELKDLEAHGIDLRVNSVQTNFKVAISCVTGDNLFLNGLLGFVESFSASHPCRHCNMNKTDFQRVFTERESSVRTVQSYTADVALNNVQLTGVKFNSPLNCLTYFHAALNCVQDVMHDLLEGACSYDMRNICNSLIADKNIKLTLHELNTRLQSVNYGYHDMSSRPPVFTSLDNELLPLQAAEVWCMLRYLPFAVGPQVPADNKNWLVFLSLRKLMDIVMSPTILCGEVDLLRVLISEYMEKRQEVFGDTLKPKHHHLIHYPRIIEHFGPIVRYWCMRFEQKHQRYKRLMHIVSNFKNVPKTIASRHQLDFALTLASWAENAHDQLEIGPGFSVRLSEMVEGQSIAAALGTDLNCELFQANWVAIKGTMYKPRCYLHLGYDSILERPSFGQVTHIFIRDQSNVMFYCDKLNVLCFDDHFHAWSVEHTFPKTFTCADPAVLTYFIPHALQSVTVDGVQCAYICLRHRV